MEPPAIRHVRYRDFVELRSDGTGGDLEHFRAQVDALVRQMGPLHAHHIVFDLRDATLPALPSILLVEALEHMRRRGLGVDNKVAIVIDPGDAPRLARMGTAEIGAARMGMELRAFVDYKAALDWLNSPQAT
jgi:hypothetical protein